MMPLDVLFGGISYKIRKWPFFYVFDYFLAPIAMATTETSKTTYEWNSSGKRFNLIPHMLWSDTDMKNRHMMQINIQKIGKLTQKFWLGG